MIKLMKKEKEEKKIRDERWMRSIGSMGKDYFSETWHCHGQRRSWNSNTSDIPRFALVTASVIRVSSGNWLDTLRLEQLLLTRRSNVQKR